MVFLGENGIIAFGFEIFAFGRLNIGSCLTGNASGDLGKHFRRLQMIFLGKKMAFLSSDVRYSLLDDLTSIPVRQETLLVHSDSIFEGFE